MDFFKINLKKKYSKLSNHEEKYFFHGFRSQTNIQIENILWRKPKPTGTDGHWTNYISSAFTTTHSETKAVDIQWSRRWRQGKRGGKRRHSCEISCVLEWEKKKFAATANSVRRSNTQLIAFTCHSEAHTAPVSIFRSRCLTHCVQSLKSCK